MVFDPPLEPARLIRRYKRFLADVQLPDGREITIHCPNTGAMLGCDEQGSRIWMSSSDNPRRKYRHTWEIVETCDGVLVGINTMRTNRIVADALAAGRISPFAPNLSWRAEFRIGSDRFDFRLEGSPAWTVEVKNVTAAVESGLALFPDARSERAARHLDGLVERRKLGEEAALIYCVQRGDVEAVRPAHEIDPEYAAAVQRARAAGVHLWAYSCQVSPAGIVLERPIKVDKVSEPKAQV